MHRLLLLLSLTATPAFADAARIDTVFSWRGYGQTGTVRVAVYSNPADEDRPTTVVLRELAENAGPSCLEDARFLIEQVSRAFGIDPEAAAWVFHWGAFSYEGAQGRKSLFLRATVRRGRSGDLLAPSWRLVSHEDVEEMTDRGYRG